MFYPNESLHGRKRNLLRQENGIVLLSVLCFADICHEAFLACLESNRNPT